MNEKNMTPAVLKPNTVLRTDAYDNDFVIVASDTGLVRYRVDNGTEEYLCTIEAFFESHTYRIVKE